LCNSSASLAGLVLSFIARFILLVIAPLINAACIVSAAAATSAAVLITGVWLITHTRRRHGFWKKSTAVRYDCYRMLHSRDRMGLEKYYSR